MKNSAVRLVQKMLLIIPFLTVELNAQYPVLSQYVVSGPTSTTFKYENCFLNQSCHENQPKRKTEVPPWIIGGGWRTYFFVDGKETNIWSTPASLVTSTEIDLKNNAVGPYKASAPYIHESFSPYVNIKDWKRNYAGIYTAQYINHSTEGTVSLGFSHGENKNELAGSSCTNGGDFQNTIQLNVPIDCNNPNTYTTNDSDGWDAYNGLISASWIHNNAQTNWGQGYFDNDLGPIAWPNNGFVTSSGVKCTTGFRHPSSILYNDYVYIFVVQGKSYNGNITETEGRMGGVKLLKVHKDQALNASNYSIYYKDPSGNVLWNPSLPAGLTKDNMLSYVAVPGPKSSDILDDNGATGDVVRFSVAKVNNKNYFIGVEEYHDWGSAAYNIAIRFSDDLLTWSPRQFIYQSTSWGSSLVNYPVFLDKTGWSNTEIDEDDFYIVGTEDRPIDHVNKLHIYKYVPPPPPPPPPTDCPPGMICYESEGSQPAMLKVGAGIAETKAGNIQIFPNPARQEVSVRVEANNSKPISLTLYTLEGKILQRKQYTLGKGSNTVKIDLANYRSGVYYLETLINNKKIIKKIVKL